MRIVAADGSPERVQTPALTIDCNNEQAFKKALANAMKNIQQYVTPLPNSDGAASYEALAVARDVAQGLNLKNPTIICLLCGLDTTGPLNMTPRGRGPRRRSGLCGSPHRNPTADPLRRVREGGRRADCHRLHRAALGTPERASDREHLTAIWTRALEAGRATVEPDPYPASGDPIKTDHTVWMIVLATIS